MYVYLAPSDRYKIVCYYGAWSVYRKAPNNFGVADIGKKRQKMSKLLIKNYNNYKQKHAFS
jgi:hypothetical protein